MHVDSMFQIYEGLTDPLAGTGRAWLPKVDEPLVRMRNATYQSIIVHLDMLKANQGVSLYALIDEAQAEGKLDASTGNGLRAKIDTHAITLRNIGRQRNNISGPSLNHSNLPRGEGGVRGRNGSPR